MRNLLKQINLRFLVAVLIVPIVFWISHMTYVHGEITLANLPKLPPALSDGDHPKIFAPSLTLKVSLPKVPESMMVYRVVHLTIDEAWVTQLAEKHFGITGPIEIAPTSWLTAGNDEYQIEVDPNTGFFSLYTKGFTSKQAKITGGFPTKDVCSKTAENFLSARGLLPADSDYYLRGIADNTTSCGVMSVGFGRIINGFECWGAGAEILVEIGKMGIVGEIKKAWQELIPFGEYPIKSPAEAVEELISGKGILYHGEKGEIKNITFVYYASPIRQEYVQPCYYFKCLEPKMGTEFYGLVEAIRPEYCVTSGPSSAK